MEVYVYEYDLATKDSVLREKNIYNTNGAIVRRLNYENGKIMYTGIFENSESGLKICEKGYDPSGKLFQIFAYAYDKNRNETDYKQLRADSSTVLVHQKREYNEKGRYIKLYNKSEEKDIFHLGGTFDYDDKGRVIQFTLFGKDGGIYTMMETIYDDANNVEINNRVNGDERKLHSIHLFDKKHQLIEISYYELPDYIKGGYAKQAVASRINYSYDEKGNKIEETAWRKNILQSRKKYFYKTKK